MNKIIYVISLVALLITSCKKENNDPISKTTYTAKYTNSDMPFKLVIEDSEFNKSTILVEYDYTNTAYGKRLLYSNDTTIIIENIVDTRLYTIDNHFLYLDKNKELIQLHIGFNSVIYYKQ